MKILTIFCMSVTKSIFKYNIFARLFVNNREKKSCNIQVSRENSTNDDIYVNEIVVNDDSAILVKRSTYTGLC